MFSLDRRNKLEDSRRYQYFKRDADELESWIYEKLQTASDESYKDPTNLQVCTYGKFKRSIWIWSDLQLTDSEIYEILL